MTDDISKVDKPAPNWCPRCHKRPDDVTFCTHSFHSLESATTPAEVARFDIGYTEWGAGVMPKAGGTYVRYDDYASLARQLAEAKDEASKWESLSDAAQIGLSVQHKREVRLESALAAATRRVAEVEGLLRRYRDEVPLGHQPHMIAHLVDAALKEPK